MSWRAIYNKIKTIHITNIHINMFCALPLGGRGGVEGGGEGGRGGGKGVVEGGVVEEFS